MVHKKGKLCGRLCWPTFVVFHMDRRHHDVGPFISSDIFVSNCWIFVEPSTEILSLEATPRFHLLLPGIRNMTTMRTCLVGVTLAPINAKYCTCSGPGSVVGIATGYGLDGPEIESRWGRDFPHLSRPALGLPSLLYNGYRVFPGGKERPGRDADPSPPSSAVVKKG